MTTNPTMQTLQYEATKKSIGVAYVLWFFFGGLGAYRFYLKKTGSAVTMLVITLVSALLTIVVIGIVGLIAMGIWVIVDAFLIPGWISTHNLKIVNALKSDI